MDQVPETTSQRQYEVSFSKFKAFHYYFVVFERKISAVEM